MNTAFDTRADHSHFHPHKTVATFTWVQDVLGWRDPHRESIWEEASDADETQLFIARDLKEGTIGWRMVLGIVFTLWRCRKVKG